MKITNNQHLGYIARAICEWVRGNRVENWKTWQKDGMTSDTTFNEAWDNIFIVRVGGGLEDKRLKSYVRQQINRALASNPTELATAHEPLPEHPAPEQQDTMDTTAYQDKPVTSVTLVFGEDVAQINEQRALNMIKANNAAIEELEKTGITSTRLAQRITGYKAANEALTTRLDSFTTEG